MKSVREIRLLYHSVRHVPTAQLWARLRLMVRRQWRQRFGPPRGFQAPPPRRTDAPSPVFPAREHLLVRHGKSVALDLLKFEVAWSRGIDWHPPVSKDWTHLRRFHLHYMEYCEAFGDTDFIDAVDSWIGNNPAYTGAYWHDSWSSYVISLRTVVWMQQIAVRPDLPADFVERVCTSIARQVRVLFDHLELDIRGNHLVKNAKALVWAGAFFDGPEAAAWSRRGERLLAEIIDEQILPDGMHYELSASYHAQVFADLLECVAVLPDSGVRAELLRVFPRMGHALVCMTHPDGGPALFNDAGLGMAYPASQVLAVARPYIGEVSVPKGRFSLPDAGYYGFRRDGDYLLVKAGKIGPDALPAHSHADLLSVEWDVGGQRVIVDPGVYEYEGGPMRDYARGTVAHNTVTIDALDQAEMHSAFRAGRRCSSEVLEWGPDPDRLALKALQDGYARLKARPVHYREVTFEGTRLCVSDRVEGGSGQVVESRLMLHPMVKLHPCAGGLELRIGGKSVRWHSSTPFTISDANWLPDLGVAVATQQICLRYGVAPAGGLFELQS